MKRNGLDPFVSTNRLFAAADVLLRAMHSTRGFNSRISMTVGEHRVGESPPASTFTSEEFIEAMDMLIRMDLVPARHSAQGAS